jgi:hypothetical protein
MVRELVLGDQLISPFLCDRRKLMRPGQSRDAHLRTNGIMGREHLLRQGVTSGLCREMNSGGCHEQQRN